MFVTTVCGYFNKKKVNYYPQVFLKECKYIEKKIIRHIIDNLSDFLLMISLSCASKNTEHYFSNDECTQKKGVLFLKLCLQCIKIQKAIQ